MSCKSYSFDLLVYTCTTLLLFLCVKEAKAQISQPGKPPSNELKLNANPPAHSMPAVSNTSLRKEESEDDPRFVFGHIFDKDIGLAEGEWSTLPDGDRVWRTRIISEKAFSMRLIFDEFRLPVGADHLILILRG